MVSMRGTAQARGRVVSVAPPCFSVSHHFAAPRPIDQTPGHGLADGIVAPGQETPLIVDPSLLTGLLIEKPGVEPGLPAMVSFTDDHQIEKTIAIDTNKVHVRLRDLNAVAERELLIANRPPRCTTPVQARQR